MSQLLTLVGQLQNDAAKLDGLWKPDTGVQVDNFRSANKALDIDCEAARGDLLILLGQLEKLLLSPKDRLQSLYFKVSPSIDVEYTDH